MSLGIVRLMVVRLEPSERCDVEFCMHAVSNMRMTQSVHTLLVLYQKMRRDAGLPMVLVAGAGLICVQSYKRKCAVAPQPLCCGAWLDSGLMAWVVADGWCSK